MRERELDCLIKNKQKKNSSLNISCLFILKIVNELQCVPTCYFFPPKTMGFEQKNWFDSSQTSSISLIFQFIFLSRKFVKTDVNSVFGDIRESSGCPEESECSWWPWCNSSLSGRRDLAGWGRDKRMTLCHTGLLLELK